MPETASREKIRAEQSALLSALLGNGRAPEGFDRSRLLAAAEALSQKRSRAVARAWPALARTLPRFQGRFSEFAARTPLPGEGGPIADGRAFVRALDPALAASLGDEARLEVLSVDLRFARVSSGLAPRRGIKLASARLVERGRFVLAVLLPWLGERWFSLPLLSARSP
ncbi:hypothetical protein HY251_15955 [bacterium]|nr:hypothetical protein [bacterium]